MFSAPRDQTKISFTFLLLCSVIFSQQGLASEVLVDMPSVGMEALPAPSSYVLGSGDLGFEDGKIDTKSTGSVQTDQKYVGGFNAAASYLFVPQFSARLNLRGKYTDRLVQDQADSTTQATSKYAQVFGNLAGHLTTSNGFEVFGGLKAAVQPKYTRTKKLPAFTSTTAYSSSQLYSPFAGIIKRSGPWSAGFFYELGSEKQRHLVRKTQDYQDESDQYQTLPSTLGGMARFSLGGNFEMNLELALVMLGDSDEKSTETSDTLNKDYYRAHLSVLYPLVASSLNLYVGFTHRTLSYADQALMSLDNIPTTLAEIRLESLKDKTKLYMALLFTFAEDTQSLPELNATYTNRVAALKAGVVFPM